MLRIRLDVNGDGIGTIGVHNADDDDGDGNSLYHVYDLRGYDLRLQHSITDCPRIMETWFPPDAGARLLAAHVLVEIPDEYID